MIQFGISEGIVIRVCDFQSLNGYKIGRVELVVGGFSIGNDLVALVYPFVSHLESFVGKIADIKLEITEDRDCVSRFHFIEDRVFGEYPQSENGFEGSVYEEVVLCPGGGEFFDGWQVFAIPDGKFLEILFKDASSQVHCVTIEIDNFVNAARAFISWFLQA